MTKTKHTPDKTIRNILERHSGALEIGEGDRSELLRVINLDTATQAISELVLEVIGEDDVPADSLYDKGIAHFDFQRSIPHRNKLRAEQRTRIERML